jgi:hypothetical protein
VDLVRLRPLKSHRGNADSGPRAWTVRGPGRRIIPAPRVPSVR